MPTKIGNREKTYESLKRIEDVLMQSVKALEDLHDRAMGQPEVEDYKAFLANPYGYLVSEYWDKYCKHLPEHLDKHHQFKQAVNISQAEIDALHKDYRQATKALGGHAPSVTKGKVSSTLKQSNFDIYLDPKKSDEYEALKAFLDAGKVLKEQFNATGHYTMLQRFAKPGTVVVGGDATVSIHSEAFE